jgi:hypothetical protein
MTVEERRRILDAVIDQIEVRPAPNLGSLAFADRLTIRFREGYAPPPSEVEELLRIVEADRKPDASRHNSSPQLDERLFEMYRSGSTARQIGAQLRADGVPSPGRAV